MNPINVTFSGSGWEVGSQIRNTNLVGYIVFALIKYTTIILIALKLFRKSKKAWLNLGVFLIVMVIYDIIYLLAYSPLLAYLGIKIFGY